MKIYYIVPDNDKPSWGIGVIYHHVKALCESGFDAYILHKQNNFRLSWLELILPIVYQDSISKNHIQSIDFLVVPEVMANDVFVLNSHARKILFIQAAAHIFENFPPNKSHKDLGFEHVVVIMPHMIQIVKKFINLPFSVISPMIAEYFFDAKPDSKRKKEIVIYPKYNQIDFSIVRNLILRKIGSNKLRKAFGFDWRLKLLKGLSHKQVAETFHKSSIFICLNIFEALNTSVVEAMASGCIVFCYEGFGPRDFLVNGKNAFVFGNNEPYLLVEKLYEVLDNFEHMQNQLREMQSNARKTAEQFSYHKMKVELLYKINTIFETAL